MEPGQNRRGANHLPTRAIRCRRIFSAVELFGVEWFPRSEVTSTRLIEHYVANGYAVGTTVATPGFKAPPGVRVISLAGFPPVVVGAAWPGKLSSIAQQFLAEVEIEASAVKRGTKSL